MYTNSKGDSHDKQSSLFTHSARGEYGFLSRLKPRYDNFIGGDWVGTRRLANTVQPDPPVTGQPLCEIASSGRRDIDLALDAAHSQINGDRLPCRTGRRSCSKLPTG